MKKKGVPHLELLTTEHQETCLEEYIHEAQFEGLNGPTTQLLLCSNGIEGDSIVCCKDCLSYQSSV